MDDPGFGGEAVRMVILEHGILAERFDTGGVD
jgi:hypothetical protein